MLHLQKDRMSLTIRYTREQLPLRKARTLVSVSSSGGYPFEITCRDSDSYGHSRVPRVENQIVSGMKYLQVVKRAGMTGGSRSFPSI